MMQGSRVNWRVCIKCITRKTMDRHSIKGPNLCEFVHPSWKRCLRGTSSWYIVHSFGVCSHVCGGMYSDAAGSYFWTFVMTVGVAAAEWGFGGGWLRARELQCFSVVHSQSRALLIIRRRLPFHLAAERDGSAPRNDGWVCSKIAQREFHWKEKPVHVHLENLAPFKHCNC